MATENVPVFNKYEGNGAATEFSIGFPYLDTNFIKVYIKRIGEEEEKLDDSRFSFVNDTTIKFPVLDTDTVLQEGEVITIQRETSLGSEYEFDNQVRLFPEEVMNADDLAFQQIQELARDLERAVKVKPTDEKTSDELIDEVYTSLKTATETADKAIASANQAQEAADKATEAAVQAELQINETVANAVEDVRRAAVDATNDIIDQAANTVTQIAKSDVDIYVTDTITPLVSNAEADASNAAESAELAANEADESKHWAEDSRVWATGEDTEVDELESGEHSARVYSELAKAGAVRAEEAEARIGDVVHKDGEETITGQKTFLSETVFSKKNGGEGQLRILSGDENRALIFRADESDFYILFTDEGDPNGSFNSLRPLKINLTNGSVSGITPDLSTNNTVFPTTAWVKNILKSSGNGLATISKAQNGYCKFTNGLLIQWGNSGTYSNTQVKTVTLPTSFSNTNYVVLPMNSGTTSNNYYTYQPHSQTETNFKLRCQDTTGSASGSVRWVTIGY